MIQFITGWGWAPTLAHSLLETTTSSLGLFIGGTNPFSLVSSVGGTDNPIPPQLTGASNPNTNPTSSGNVSMRLQPFSMYYTFGTPSFNMSSGSFAPPFSPFPFGNNHIPRANPSLGSGFIPSYGISMGPTLTRGKGSHLEVFSHHIWVTQCIQFSTMVPKKCQGAVLVKHTQCASRHLVNLREISILSLPPSCHFWQHSIYHIWPSLLMT